MAKNSMSIRLSEKAVKVAKIAAAYTGESMATYVSRIIEERAAADIDRSHAKLVEAQKEPPARPARRKQ
jgi:hypothetical protein